MSLVSLVEHTDRIISVEKANCIYELAAEADENAITHIAKIKANVETALDDINPDYFVLADNAILKKGKSSDRIHKRYAVELRDRLFNLAERINEIRTNVVRSRNNRYRGELPVVQVRTMIEAIAEEAQHGKPTTLEDSEFILNGVEGWAVSTHTMADPQLIFSTVGLWLGYVHTSSQSERSRRRSQKIKHLSSDAFGGSIFFRMLESDARRDYFSYTKVVEQLKVMASAVGTSRFVKTAEKVYL